MREITIIRHGESAYPKDTLTKKGIVEARQRVRMTEFVPMVVTSEFGRAQATAQCFGRVGQPDARVNEIVVDEINAPTAHEYVMRVLSECPEIVATEAKSFMELLAELPDRSVVFSHNAKMAALLQTIDGQKTSFVNLEGFAVRVEKSGRVTFGGWRS